MEPCHFTCEERFFNTSLSAVPSTLLKKNPLPYLLISVKPWGYICQVGQCQMPQDLKISLYGICIVYMSGIPETANGPAAFVTSQQVNRPVWTGPRTENSCPWNPILMLRTLYLCSYKHILFFSESNRTKQYPPKIGRNVETKALRGGEAGETK